MRCHSVTAQVRHLVGSMAWVLTDLTASKQFVLPLDGSIAWEPRGIAGGTVFSSCSAAAPCDFQLEMIIITIIHSSIDGGCSGCGFNRFQPNHPHSRCSFVLSSGKQIPSRQFANLPPRCPTFSPQKCQFSASTRRKMMRPQQMRRDPASPCPCCCCSDG